MLWAVTLATAMNRRMSLSLLQLPVRDGRNVHSAIVAMTLPGNADATHVTISILQTILALCPTVQRSGVRHATDFMRLVHVTLTAALYLRSVGSVGELICLEFVANAARAIACTLHQTTAC